MAESEVQEFLARLERQLSLIREAPPVTDTFAFPASVPSDRKRRAQVLTQNALRTLLLAGSFADLPLDGRVHPAVQARVMDHMQEMDDATQAMRSFLEGLTPTERADIGRALRDDPELGMNVVAAIDTEALEVGVSMQRRLHMRRLAAHICARMKQSTPLLLEDTLRKVEKVAALDTDLVAAERRMLAQLGETRFTRLRDDVSHAQARWRVASSGASLSDGAHWGSPPIPPPRRGVAALTTGGILMGFGALHGLLGLALLNTEAVALGLTIGFTLGGILFIGGLITLIVGASLYASSAP
jgi:hypothetical protein